MGNIVDLRPGRTPQRAKRAAPPASQSRKPLPLRARRRRARLLYIVLAILAIAALVYGVHWLSYLPRLNIASVEVAGAQSIPSELIVQYADSVLHDGSYHFISRSNIFFYPKSVLARDIVADFPGIHTAVVSRNGLFSQTMTIRIAERQPFAKWCEGAQCYVLDDSGYMYAALDPLASTALPNPYVFSGALSTSTNPVGQTFIPGHMPGVIVLLTILQQQTGLSPYAISISDEHDFTITFTEGFDLKVSFGEDAATVARNLKLVLASESLLGKESDIEYVDLRFGDRVFYKLKGEAQEAAQ